MIKSRGTKGKARVTFTIDPGVGAQAAAVCGEWNGWSAGADVMKRDAEGGFSVTVDLDAGRAYRFRYLLDGRRWDNDWAADAYVRNDFGGRRLGGGPDRAGRGGPAGHEKDAGEEGGARGDCQEGSARNEASREAGQIARARRGGAAAGLIAPHRTTCPCGFLGRQRCSW